ncbi:FG-GAP-like repeat-containing protein [Nocardioides marmorisolisilvae]|nr:FG-GAP-like repeat-containing protein [Nocardioides marmorisolisilvae]
MRRQALALTAGLIALAVTSPPVGAAPVAPPRVTQTAQAVPPIADFDNDGSPDLAIGAPGEDVGTVRDAGAVTVTGPHGRVFTQNSAGGGDHAESNDHFGSAVATGDFNGDGFTDLAVGAPTESVGSVAGAGAVNILYGSANGLTATGAQVFTQNSPGVASSAEQSDFFGSALAAADFNHDGRADLAIGVPRENAAVADAGAVTVLFGSPTGLTGEGSRLFTQNNAGTGNKEERADLFGSALAAGDFDDDGFPDLAVGVPGEDVYSVLNAGAVNVLRGSAGGLTGTGGRLFTENSTGLAGTAESGDGFGAALATGHLDPDAYADLAIGVPAEDVGSIANAGAAYTLRGSAAGLTGAGSRLLTENAPDHPDQAEAGDDFGFSLAAVDLYGVGDELVIGAPGEDLGPAREAGAVFVGSAMFREGGSNTAGKPQTSDRLGASLADNASSPAQIVVGAPGENRGAGAVLVITGSLDDGDQLPPSGAFLNQAAGAAETGDFFGAAVAGS